MKKKSNYILCFILFYVITICGCSSITKLISPKNKEDNAKKKANAGENKKIRKQKKVFNITSSKFSSGNMIPRKYTCQGTNFSPPLKWANPPEDTKSFVLIFEDIDAPGGEWVHWVLYNIPPELNSLSEDILSKSLPAGVVEGKNSWGKLGYGGPCPIDGTHRYFFKLYAINKKLDLKTGAHEEEVLKEIDENIVADVELMGLYNKD